MLPRIYDIYLSLHTSSSCIFFHHHLPPHSVTLSSPTTGHPFLHSYLILHHHETFPSILTLSIPSNTVQPLSATMVVTRSSLDTGRGLPVKVSWGSQKTRNMTNPLSSEQLGQKRKSASDPSKSEEPARKKHAKENRFATARSSDVAPLNKKRKSGQGDPLPSGHQSTGPASDFEAPCFKKLKVANPATEKSSGRKLLSPGPTLLSMPREIRDMILGDTFGNRTLHIEQGNTWSKSVNIYQVSDPFAWA